MAARKAFGLRSGRARHGEWPRRQRQGAPAPLVARGAIGSRGTMMQPLLAEYFPILVFLAIAGGIAIAMVGGSLLAARQKPYAGEAVGL